MGHRIRRYTYHAAIDLGGRESSRRVLDHEAAAALRWRYWDPSVKSLGKLLVAVSYNTRKHRARRTKMDVVRHVPLHPTLTAILAEWHLSGWAAMMGR
jgi:hypothetical protein